MATDIPAGYKTLNLVRSGFIHVNGPLYGRIDEDNIAWLGLRIEERHCNPAGICHGGMLATLADMVLGFGIAVQGGVPRFMPTVTLSCDYLAPAPLGTWVEGRATVRRVTRNLAFADCLLTADGESCLRGNGILKIPSKSPVTFSPRDFFK